MIGLILLAGVVLWLALGVYVLKRLSLWRSAHIALRAVAAAGFLVVWGLGPFADEYLGQKSFKRLCDDMPDMQFFGPVSVGEGPFFDAQGEPRWASEHDLDVIAYGDPALAFKQRGDKVWRMTFSREEVNHRIASWPVPVVEQVVRYRFNQTGQVIFISHWRGSPGGWLKRASGWGSHAPLQCNAKGTWPPLSQWIKY